MNENMENLQAYIFIAIIVIITIFNVIKEARKKLEKDKKPVILPQKEKQLAEMGDSNEWEKWFEQDDVMEESETENIPITPILKKDPYVRIPQENQSDKQINKESCRHLSDPKVKLHSKEEVRRAIIYSEIIKRKY